MAYFVLHTRHRIGLPVLAAVLLAFGTFGTAFAQEDILSNVDISLEVDPPNVEFADEVTLTLEVTFPDNYSVVVHKLPERWGPAFEVRDQSQAHTVSNDDGTKTTSQTIRAVVFGRGTVQTPDLPISVRGRTGQSSKRPHSEELIVGSVLPRPDAEPKDIRRQADIATQIWEQPVARAGAALVAVLALCALGYLLYRRFRGQDGAPLPVVDPRTPWEIAIDELDRIERLDLPEDGRFKEHYTLVAATMRVYVQAMYLEGRKPGRRHRHDD